MPVIANDQGCGIELARKHRDLDPSCIRIQAVPHKLGNRARRRSATQALHVVRGYLYLIVDFFHWEAGDAEA